MQMHQNTMNRFALLAPVFESSTAAATDLTLPTDCSQNKRRRTTWSRKPELLGVTVVAPLTLDRLQAQKELAEKNTTTAVRYTGRLTAIVAPQGYGFIQRDDRQKDVFVPPSSMGRFRKGDRVSFQTMQGARGLVAYDLQTPKVVREVPLPTLGRVVPARATVWSHAPSVVRADLPITDLTPKRPTVAAASRPVKYIELTAEEEEELFDAMPVKLSKESRTGYEVEDESDEEELERALDCGSSSDYEDWEDRYN